jgi:hypothetical protein
LAILLVHGRQPGEGLPAADRYVDVERVEFKPQTEPTNGLGRDQGRSAAQEWLVNGV